LAEGEKLHPANYRGYRHVKEIKKKKSQRKPRTTRGSGVFSSNHTIPDMSFAAALRGKTEEQQQSRTHQVAGPDTLESRVPAASPQHEQQKEGQSFRAPNINSLSLDKLLKVEVTVVQQIMTEPNGAVLDKAKILVITKTVLNIME
jgi:hypothetical protein